MFVCISTHWMSGYVRAINISIFKNRSLSLVLITSLLPSLSRWVSIVARTCAQLAASCLLTNCLRALLCNLFQTSAVAPGIWFTVGPGGNRDCLFLSSGLVAAGARNLDFGSLSSSRPDCAVHFSSFSLCRALEFFVKLWKHKSTETMLGLLLLRSWCLLPWCCSFEFLRSLRNPLAKETWWTAVLTTLWWSSFAQLSECVHADLGSISSPYPKA